MGGSGEVRLAADDARGALASAKRIVLVVDDHPHTGEMVTEYLLFRGVRCVEAKSVAEANHLLEHLPVDVIVTDYAMPQEDGLTFLRGIRSTARGAAMPVGMVSGRDPRGEVARAALELDARFVPKPFDLTELATAVQSALGSIGS